MSDKELTEYLDDPVPLLNRVEHATEEEPLSAIVEPPTTGGSSPPCTRMQPNQDFVRKYISHESGSTSH